MSQGEKKNRVTWGRALLTLSLALNLLFVGAIVGASWMRHKHGAYWGGPPKFVIDRILRDLSEPKRAHIHELLGQHRQMMRKSLDEIGLHKRDLMKVMRNKPFVPARIEEISQKLRLVRGQIGEARTRLLINVLEGLTDEERRKLVASHMFRRLLAMRQRR